MLNSMDAERWEPTQTQLTPSAARMKRMGPKPKFKATKAKRIYFYRDKVRPLSFAEMHRKRGTENLSAGKIGYKRGVYREEDNEIILRMIQEGKTNTQIAGVLKRSVYSVKRRIEKMREQGLITTVRSKKRRKE